MLVYGGKNAFGAAGEFLSAKPQVATARLSALIVFQFYDTLMGPVHM